MNTTETFENCTIYMSSEFMGNYNAYKCKWVNVEVKPYAQYQAAVHITFLEKGKRNPRQTVQSYKPSLVIAEGWNTPAPPDLFGKPISSSNGMEVRQGSHQSFSGNWKTDFYATVIPNVTVLADYHGHNSHDRFTALQPT